MERLFQILAVILAGIAAYFLWRSNGDGAFIAAVIGAVCFFISIRFQVKGRLKEREAAREEDEKRRQGEGETRGRGDAENFDSQNALNDVSANEQIDQSRTTNNERLTNL